MCVHISSVRARQDSTCHDYWAGADLTLAKIQSCLSIKSPRDPKNINILVYSKNIPSWTPNQNMMAARQSTLAICLPTIIMNAAAINKQTHNNISCTPLLADRTVYYYNSSEPYSYAPASMWWISGLQPSGTPNPKYHSHQPVK